MEEEKTVEPIKIDINKACDDFYKNLIKTINESGLPIGITYHIYKSVESELQVGYNNSIKGAE